MGGGSNAQVMVTYPEVADTKNSIGTLPTYGTQLININDSKCNTIQALVTLLQEGFCLSFLYTEA
jgi:hypothetical protein